jgi:hypothetical protein
MRYQTWEIAATYPQHVAGRAHCQNNMQIIFCLFEEIVPHILLRVEDSLFESLLSDLINHGLLAFFVEQRRYHTNCEQIIYKFQKSLLNDMRICEEE